MSAMQPPSLRQRALALLARRDCSRAELERKLAAHAQAPGQLAALLDDLTRRGWLSDARAAEALVARKAARWGDARLRQALAERGIETHAARAALAQVGENAGSEHERARALWRERFGASAAALRADRLLWARQARFLHTRGFGAEVVRRVLDEAMRSAVEDS